MIGAASPRTTRRQERDADRGITRVVDVSDTDGCSGTTTTKGKARAESSRKAAFLNDVAPTSSGCSVYDSKQATALVREVIAAVRAKFGPRLALEFRMDAAFQRDILRVLAAQGGAYTVKV